MYGDADPEDGMGDEIKDEHAFTLADVVRSSRARFRYLYDFGDCWWHAINVEKIAPRDGERCTMCVGGERNHVPEDCGGPGGFQNLLRVLADPEHGEQRELLTLVGDGYDPEAFDLDAVNLKLSALAAWLTPTPAPGAHAQTSGEHST